MKNKEYKFKESKVSELFSYVGLGIFMLGIILAISFFIVSFFTTFTLAIIGISCFMLSVPIAAPLVFISMMLSKRDEFTRNFIKEIKTKLEDAVTLDDLVAIEKEIFAEAIDREGMVRLSFPLTIKKLLDEVQNKIDILEKQI